MADEYGRLDVLINNAGTAEPRVGAEDLTADAAMDGFAINVFGPIRVMHAFLPLLRAAEHPRIVNVSSGVGSFARLLTPGSVENAVTLPVYPATKAAHDVDGPVRESLDGILINAADPGFTATDYNNTVAHRPSLRARTPLSAWQPSPTGPTGTFQGRDGIVPW